MKFKITITKEVIDKSLMCGVDANILVHTNCAFAVAYNQLIPNTEVTHSYAWFDDEDGNNIGESKLMGDQIEFIQTFDCFSDDPTQRYTLVGQTFDVEIPDEVIEYWHGDAVTAAQKLIDNPIMQTV